MGDDKGITKTGSGWTNFRLASCAAVDILGLSPAGSKFADDPFSLVMYSSATRFVISLVASQRRRGEVRTREERKEIDHREGRVEVMDYQSQGRGKVRRRYEAQAVSGRSSHPAR